jgi:uncharacterized protein (TIGR00730 family)
MRKKEKATMKAYDDPEFLHGNSARYIRVLSEFIQPEERFRKNGIRNTIVFFGSARAMPEKQARSRILNPGEKLDKRMLTSETYKACVELARRITEWSNKIKDPARRFYICSGGGPGIMEAANKGASLAKGKSIGLNISLPFEQMANPYITPELNLEFHYFFIRKFWFLYYAKALVAFPGGFGTFDEVFELLTLLQTRKLKKRMPVVLYGKEFWNSVFNFNALIEYGVIAREDLALFKIFDEVDAAYDYIVSELKRMPPHSLYS